MYAPLYEALLKHVSTNPTPYHVPGHQHGRAFRVNQEIEEYTRPLYPMAMLDLTEIRATDDLHHPEASIHEAASLAAACYGAEESFFLVGGSTAGNVAMILTACSQPDDIILVQRNVHKSVLNGLKLAGASAVFLAPQIDESSGVATVPTLNHVRQALEAYPQARAVLLSNPNYYGMGTELTEYASLIHSYECILLVDEAHGAHYGLHPELPPSALQAGADAVVQSTHKTLTALTMGAMLHVQGSRIQRQQLRHILSMVQSSSPSFPIMASLDIARAMVDHYGEALFEPCLASASSIRGWIRQSQSVIGLLEDMDREGIPAYEHSDPLRLVIYDRTGTHSGVALQRKLEESGIWTEMADDRYVVLVIGIGSTAEDRNKLIAALETVSLDVLKDKETVGDGQSFVWNTSSSPQMLMPPEEQVAAPVPFHRFFISADEVEIVPLNEAVGRRSAEMIIPYPPGIPVLYEGEVIMESTVQLLQKLSDAGAKLQGASDPSVLRIKVMQPPQSP
ncbi:aminotransferase class I/II-fold pyridoxal phosphate-dependent enzyme [Paenibacillus sp. GCM10023252]|uniref:aminotransferase class I/II-fold pyridoxal phosphate-dependent enzyme n=1 Tax=Paenibacillus sp. GCM10023252 TaxID=3252649 RepID=UPI0036076D38